MSTQALIRRDASALTIEITDAAKALKEQALNAAALIPSTIKGASDQENAVRAQQGLADFVSTVEKARQEAKAPLLNAGRELDETCRKFVEDPKAELLRLTTTIGDFQELERAKARAAEQVRLAEERRIAQERRDAELAVIRAAEAERLRLAQMEAETARLAQAAKSKAEKEALARQQVEIDRQKALAEAKSHEDLDRINEVASNAQAALAEQPKYEPVRAHGQMVRNDWEITVSDVWALARAHPACVDITPRVGEIKALLKAGVEKIPGVSAKPIVKSGTSRGRTVGAIEV